jgi:hypothetical protein
VKYTYSVKDDDLIVRDSVSGITVWQGRPEGYPVKEAVALPGADDCIVLYPYMSSQQRIFDNLVRCRCDGSVVWRAELPETSEWDAYVAVQLGKDGLTANSWSCWYVTLDPDTGRILSARFTK